MTPRRPDRAVRIAAALALLGVFGCQRRPPPPPPSRPAHYVVGPSWRSDAGAWFYPVERASFQATGLAVVEQAPAGTVMADGESFDPAAATASVQTLQLPSVVEVHDLENGRTLFVRVIGRGPADPGRLIALSASAARRLGVQPGQTARVEITLDGPLTEQLDASLAGAPKLAIAAAPVGAVTEQALGPPGSAAPASPAQAQQQAAAGAPGAAPPAPSIPDGVTQGTVAPGALWVDGGHFDGRAAADTVAQEMGAEAEQDGGGRHPGFRVLAGPFGSVEQADAALDQARHAGVTGAHIIVE